ncbi:MAG: regulatory protein RecX [Selenomonadaceae bacterium]|nr:regulatory protein RecX [Selenomonadaceae bacterium]
MLSPITMSRRRTIEPDTKTALMKATDLLARQDQSERALKRKLTARKYAADEIDEALDKLKQHNYLNDEETCARQFERLYDDGKLSLKQIYAKLLGRGFDGALIDKQVPSDVDEHERAAALRALRAKFRAVPEDKKMWQHLSYRGFDGETIAFAVNEFKNNLGR